jgi:uncharacterized protein involved in outer membrane biogenesis
MPTAARSDDAILRVIAREWFILAAPCFMLRGPDTTTRTVGKADHARPGGNLAVRKSLRHGAVAVLLLLVVLAVLPALLIDKDTVKRRISRAAYEATGRELAIAGEIGFSFLPTPHLTAEGVRLANWPDSAEPWMLSVRRVVATVSPLALLRGDLAVGTLELDSPTLLLERRAGRGNWAFVPPGRLPPRPDAAPAAASAATEAATETAAAVALAFNRVAVHDGRIAYRDANGDKAVTAEKIEAKVDAQAAAGPFQVRVQAEVAGQPVKLSGSLGQIQTGRAVTLRFDVDVEPAHLHLDGLLLRATDEGPVLKAAAELSSADASRLAKRLGLAAPELAGKPVALSGQVRLTAVGGDLSDGQLRLGPVDGTAKLSWSMEGTRPRVSAEVKARRVDLDAFSAPSHAARADDAVPTGLVSTAFAQSSPAPSLATAFGFSPPRGIDLDLVLGADAVIWRGQAAQAVACEVSFSRGDMAIQSLSADLPGAAQIRASGFVGSDPGNRNVDLSVQAGAANLRGLLDWLGVEVGGVPADRLRRAAINATVGVAPDGLIRVRDVDLMLDASRGKGALDLRWGEKPAFGLSLIVDQFNLDAYRASAAADDAAAVPAEPRAIPAAVEAAPSVPAVPLWDRFDANLDLRIGKLTLGGQPLDRFAALGRWQAGTLDVSALAADIGGEGKLAASGRIVAQGEGAPRVDALKASIVTPRADRLLGLLPVSLPGFARDWRALTATLSADGPLSDLQAEVAAAVADVRFTLAGRFDAVRMAPVGDGDATLSAPNLGALAAVFGAETTPDLARKGGVEIYVPLNGDAHGYAIPALTATAGEIALTGELAAKTDGPRPRLDARLKGNLLPVFTLSPPRAAERRPAERRPAVASSSDASSVAAASAAPSVWWTALRGFDGSLDASFDKVVGPMLSADAVTVQAQLENGVLRVDRAAARLLGGSAEAKGSADLSALPKLAGTVTAKGVTVDAKSPLFAGNAPLAGRLDLSAEGNSAGGDANTLLRGLNGKGEFAVRDGSFAGVDLGAVNDRLGKVKSMQDLVSAVEAGGRGRTAFAALTGRFAVAGGVLKSDDLKMDAPSGQGSANGTADLVAKRINAEVRFALASLNEAPPLGLKLQGAWESPRVIFDSGEFQAYMIQKGLNQFLKGLKKGGDKPAARGNEPPLPAKVKLKDVLREALDAIPAQ